MPQHHAPVVENTPLQRPLGNHPEALVTLIGSNLVAQHLQVFLPAFEQLHEFTFVVDQAARHPGQAIVPPDMLQHVE